MSKDWITGQDRTKQECCDFPSSSELNGFIEPSVDSAYDDYVEMHAWEENQKLKAENAKLREWCSELLHMAESNDPDFLHWPEIHDELRKLGVEIVKL